ncbi:MAG: LuxR C-terminal-related transcriptional regulator [Solirubrobacterales bacterium]
MKTEATGIGQLLVQSSSAMLLADDHRTIVDANPAASDLLGVDHSLLIGMKIEELSSPELRGAAPEMFEAFLRDGSQSGPYTIVRGDGTKVECSYSASANVGPGLHLSILVPRERADSALDSEASQDEEVGREDGPDQISLTDREREILTMLALGETNQTIAKKLNLAPETVRTHTRTARLRLGARSRSHAITLALRAGQLDLD